MSSIFSKYIFGNFFQTILIFLQRARCFNQTPSLHQCMCTESDDVSETTLFRVRLYSVFAYSVFVYSVFAYSVFAYSAFAYSVFDCLFRIRLFRICLFRVRLFCICLFRICLFRVRRLQPIKLRITSISLFALICRELQKFIRTSCLECGCLENCVLIIYSRLSY